MTRFVSIQKNIVRPISCERNAGTGSFLISGILVLILSVIVFAPVADAGCACSSAGNWDPYAFLNSDTEDPHAAQTGGVQASAPENSGSGAQKPIDRLASYPNNEIFKSMKSVSSSDLVIDVSNGDSYAKSHIKGAIHIPTKELLNAEGDLKNEEELAKVLGDAGVSIDAPIILYGSKESSGEAEFAFLVLRYLGQEDVRLLDGSLEEWKDAGLPVEASVNNNIAVEYKPEINPDLLANYEQVKADQAQIVDARPFVEFGKGRIPGSVALDPANIIKGDKIKNGEDLSYVFNRLSKDKPIIVYSSDYSRSSLVWYALQLMGYEASLYTWEDWKAHQATGAQDAAVPVGGAAAGSSSKYTKLGMT